MVSAADLKKALNPAQFEAASSLDGPLLILAGAGSGKTRVLVHRTAHLLYEERAYPYELFCVTFTNKAASEMKHRLQTLLNSDLRGAWIGTFHGLAARILRQEGYRLGYSKNFTIYDTDDTKRVIKRILADMGVGNNSYAVSPPQILWEIDRAKNRGESARAYAKNEERYTPPAKLTRAVYPKYQSALKRAYAVDFGDLLILAEELLAHHPEAASRFRDRFQYVMVDEFQDTNSVQYDLLKLLARDHKNLAVVGDDDQSIYGWRGAEVKNIFEFEKSFPDAKVVRLEQNYRSTGNILKAANSVIRQNPHRHAKTLFTEEKPGAPVKLACYQSGEQEAAAVALMIRRKLDDGADPSEFAILYRNNAQSRAFEEAFIRRRIPHVVVGGTGFYARKEVKDVLAYLRILANPKSDADFERIVNVPPRKIGATTVQRLRDATAIEDLSGIGVLDLEPAAYKAVGIGPAAQKRLTALAALLKDLQHRSQSEPASDIARAVIEGVGYLEYLDKDDPVRAEDRRANVEELVSSIAAHEAGLAHTVEEPNEDGLGIAGAQTPLQAFLDQASLMSADDRTDRTGLVSLLTFHSAKGLEFPIVFIVGLEDGNFPSERSLQERGLDEERRLFYVGITRAMRELNLTLARERRIYGEWKVRPVSRFLAELPPDVVSDMAEGARQNPSYERHELPVSRVEPADSFAVGNRVFHDTFGEGSIEGRRGSGRDLRLQIRFAVGVKNVVARFVKSL